MALQQMLDEANAWGVYCYDKGTYLENLSDEVISVITEQVPAKRSPMSAVLLYRLDGAYSAVDDADTAFSGGRSPRYSVFILGVAPDAGPAKYERLTQIKARFDPDNVFHVNANIPPA